MKKYIIMVAAWAAFASTAWAQQLPGAPDANGLTPKSDTIYVNSQAVDTATINNGNTESLGVAIANGGSVIVGWEDDAEDSDATPLLDLEAVWTMYDSAGVSITPEQGLNSLLFPAQGVISNKFLSYFRADKSAVYGGTSWGPKIKANLFGDGLGMGATSFLLGEEIAAFAGYDDQNSGDFPSLQILTNDGQPVRTLAGVTTDFATRGGDIRIGDWDYLSTGNILIVGENRQDTDLTDIYGGSEAAHHAIFRILDPAGNVVKAETLVSEVPVKSEIWHGAGVTQNGFAVRFAGPGGATVRMFDNAGNPTTTNLDLATLTGEPIAAGGGRGDGVGFHGNGVDAYVVTSSGTDTNGAVQAWVTVLNTNGTVRFSKAVADDLALTAVESSDAAIDANGEVLAVFSGKYDPNNSNLVMGRRFDATGKPKGGTFYVSEKELPDVATFEANGPRVAWRNGQVVIIWESKNDAGTVDPTSGTASTVVAMRIFSTLAIGSIESVGLTRIVADKPLIVPQTGALGNWEPYASVLGTSTFLVEGNTFAEGFDMPDPDGKQRYVVGVQPVDGRSGALVDGFYSDDGKPFKGAINASRQNGNPGRVAGDTRPGAVNYMVGGEASPHTVTPEFTSDNRWNLGFDRLFDGRYGTVQTFKLDTSTLTPTSLSKALDSANGRRTSGAAAGNQVTRFGGDIVCLDNGNFVSLIEDRSRVVDPDNDLVVVTIFAPDGSIVKDTFVVVKGDIWSNLAPFKGGFAVRAKPQPDETGAQANTRVIYFYDNEGALKGVVDQATSGASFDTGRGDGTRLFGHINSPFVFLTGRPANTQIVKVAAFDSRNQQFVAITDVNEGAFTGNFDRANGAADALDRLTVSWVSQPAGYTNQQVAARVFAFDGTAKKFTPLTKSFFPFVNNASNSIRTLQMSVAMTTKQICVAAKGEINLQNKPDLGANSPTEVNFYTVFTHPNPQDDPTTPIGGSSLSLGIARSGSNVVLSWPVSATGFAVQAAGSLTAAAWADMSPQPAITVQGGQNTVTIPVGNTNQFYRLRK